MSTAIRSTKTSVRRHASSSLRVATAAPLQPLPRVRGARFELKEFTVTLHAQVDFQLRQMLEIVKLRLSKRGIDLACLDIKEPRTTLATAQQEVVLRHGIDAETGRKITRLVKDSKLKVQASMQGDKVRLSGKQRDDLQAAIVLLRGAKLEVPLQFTNFRD